MLLIYIKIKIQIDDDRILAAETNNYNLLNHF